LQAVCEQLSAEKVDAFLRKWLARLPPPFTPADRGTRGARTALAFVVAAGIAAALIGAPARGEPVAAPRLKVCVVSLNDPDEIEAFRSNLDPRQFELVDIRGPVTSPYSPHQSPLGQGGASWLLAACRPTLTCDVMVYSAEFAGHFFGKSGVSLSLQEMEEASCQARCAGLFRRPLEVFLLGCNTLATKDEDRRTPEQYLRVLLDHGFDQAAAERVVELRYGPLGPSFRESLRRVFAGVPRIYGFSSVAPRAEYTAPMLARYLRGLPDYAGALRRSAHDETPNRALLSAFQHTSLTQTVGLMPGEPGAIDRANVCALYDETRPLSQRLRIAYGLLARPDALRFVPTVEVFLSRHPAAKYSPIERSIFSEIPYLYAARDDVLAVVRQLDASALKLELAHFALLVGWLGQDEFHAMAVAAVRQLLAQQLSAETVDVVCAITTHESLRDDFDADSFSPMFYSDAQGIRLLSCLAPSDPRVSPPVAAALRSTDPVQREWAAYTLTLLRPSDPAVLVRLVPYLRDPSPAVAERIRWLFRVQDPLPASVAEAIRAVDPALLRERAGPDKRAR
jgi:hypothetical protein